MIDDLRAELRTEDVPSAIRRHDSATLFDWLTAALSYQGISDRVASDYMERHGRARWRDIDAKLSRGATCPKLQSYWHYYGCRYDKISRTCAEPDHIDGCPVLSHDLRNGRLNQTAYSLYLFIRDIADGRIRQTPLPIFARSAHLVDKLPAAVKASMLVVFAKLLEEIKTTGRAGQINWFHQATGPSPNHYIYPWQLWFPK